MFKEYVQKIKEEREMIRNSALIFTVAMAGAFLMFLANVAIARYFGPQSFGNFKTMVNLFFFLPALFALGIEATLVKYISEYISSKQEEKINYLLRWFLTLKFIPYLVLAGFLLIFRRLIVQYFLHDLSLAYYVIPCVILMVLSFFEINRSILAGYQNFKLLSFSAFLVSSIAAILIVALGYFFGVFGAILGYAIAFPLGNIPSLIFIYKKRVLARPKVLFNTKRIFLSYSLPMYLIAIPSYITVAIVPILSLFFDQTLIGYYAFCLSFYVAVVTISSSIGQVLFPKISELNAIKDFKKAKSKLKRALAIYAPIVLLGIIITLLFSKAIVNILAPIYLPSLLIFKSLLVLGLFLGFFALYGVYLSALKRLKRAAVIVLAGNLLLLIVSFIVMDITSKTIP